MRTLDEIEELLKYTVAVEVVQSLPQLPSALTDDIQDELRHLVAIARAAEYRLKACEEGNQDSFAAADDLLDSEVEKARKAGLFGKTEGEEG